MSLPFGCLTLTNCNAIAQANLVRNSLLEKWNIIIWYSYGINAYTSIMNKEEILYSLLDEVGFGWLPVLFCIFPPPSPVMCNKSVIIWQNHYPPRPRPPTPSSHEVINVRPLMILPIIAKFPLINWLIWIYQLLTLYSWDNSKPWSRPVVFSSNNAALLAIQTIYITGWINYIMEKSLVQGYQLVGNPPFYPYTHEQ